MIKIPQLPKPKSLIRTGRGPFAVRRRRRVIDVGARVLVLAGAEGRVAGLSQRWGRWRLPLALLGENLVTRVTTNVQKITLFG